MAHPTGLSLLYPVRAPRCISRWCLRTRTDSRGVIDPIGVRTLERFDPQLTVEDVDPRDDGVDKEVDKGEDTVGKIRREEVFKPPRP